MSANLLKLCSIIIEDNFGLTVKKVAEILIIFGPIRLGHVVTRSNILLDDTKEALKILFQHNLLGFETCEGFHEPFYTLKSDNTLFIPRVPQFLASVEKCLGLECRKIIDEVVRAGQVTMSKLFYILGYKFKKEVTGADGNALFERLVSFRSAMKRTVERKYICVCAQIVLDSLNNAATLERNEAEAFNIPKIDIRLLCEKILKNDSNLDAFPDNSIFWRVNVTQYHAELTNDLLVEAVSIRHRSYVDVNIFRALLELGTKDLQFPCVSSSVSVIDVHAYLTKTQTVPPTIDKVREQLEIIEEDSLMLITKTSSVNYGSYAVNIKSSFNHLVWTTVERTIQEKHGYFAARIFRIVKQLRYVEQDKVNEVGMIPGKNSKELTYQLVEDNFINLKEIRKSYAVSAAGHKASLVFYIDFPQVVHTVIESCYMAMINTRLRVRVEKERNARLVAKEERLDRILANMMNNECREEQLKEIREMITPPERAVLNKYKACVNKLTSAHLHVDHTLFILQMYLHYKSIK